MISLEAAEGIFKNQCFSLPDYSPRFNLWMIGGYVVLPASPALFLSPWFWALKLTRGPLTLGLRSGVCSGSGPFGDCRLHITSLNRDSHWRVPVIALPNWVHSERLSDLPHYTASRCRAGVWTGCVPLHCLSPSLPSFFFLIILSFN